MSASAARPRRLWLKLALAVSVGAVFLEVGLRTLLTLPWTADTALAREVGAPARFAYSSQDLYWAFVHRLATVEAPIYEPPHDPALGWTWTRIAPGTYVHAEESQRAERRPVLLFGDSYSACLTSREECFEGLMERNVLAGRLQLLNYGVCGYGFDQTYLLSRATIERYQGQDPIVVIGLLVDDDLKRALLSQREYPKPRLSVADGRIVAPQAPVPSHADRLADPLPLPASWAWAWLRHAFSTDPIEDPDSAARREVEELTRAMLRELVADLRQRELDAFFLLFHTADSFGVPVSDDWRTQLTCDTLDELGAPWYDVREEFARRLAERGGAIEDFYIPLDQPGGGHYGAEGNAAAFAVLLRGLNEVCGVRPSALDVPRPWAFLRRDKAGGGLVTWSSGPAQPFDRVPSANRLILRSPRDVPSSAVYALEGLARRFHARAWGYEPADRSGTFELTALLDGIPVRQLALRTGDPPQSLDLDLSGAHELELRLEVHHSQGCVVLSDPELE